VQINYGAYWIELGDGREKKTKGSWAHNDHDRVLFCVALHGVTKQEMDGEPYIAGISRRSRTKCIQRGGVLTKQ